MSRWDEKSHENAHEISYGITAKGVECGVVESVKCGIEMVWSYDKDDRMTL